MNHEQLAELLIAQASAGELRDDSLLSHLATKAAAARMMYAIADKHHEHTREVLDAERKKIFEMTSYADGLKMAVTECMRRLREMKANRNDWKSEAKRLRRRLVENG